MTPPMPPPPGPSEPPGYGYQVPPTFGMPSPGAGGPEFDPLVPPPGARFSGWFERLVATLGRSWRTLGVIIVLTFALPAVAQSLLSAGLVAGSSGVAGSPTGEELQLQAGALALTLLLQVATIFVNAIGWAAGIWAVTQDATGQPAAVADALRAGLRRSGPMFGWFLLFGLMVVVGLVACVLPGIYLFVAGSLFSFVVVYERGRGGIGRSFGLVHSQFGAALGRVLLLVAVYLAAGLAISLGTGAGALSFGLGGTGSVEAAIGTQLAFALVQAAIQVPLIMMMLVGLLLTYTQLRAGQEPVTTGHLWAAANPDPAGGMPGHPGYPPPPAGSR